MKRKFNILVATLILALIPIGCAQIESAFNSPANQRFLSAMKQQAVILGPVAMVAITDYIAGGGNMSNAQGAQLGAYAATQEVQALAASGATKQALSNAIAASVTVYSGDPKFKTPALDLAKVAVASLPANPTPQQAAAATNAVGVAISSAVSPNG